MNTATARFEFRLFGQCFDAQERRLRARAPVESITESHETYFIGAAHAADHNLKIRHGRLELKRRVDRQGDLERWQPAGQWEFPVMSGNALDLLPVADTGRWRHVLPPLLTLDELLAFVCRPEIACFPAGVFKRRIRFDVSPCSAELDQLLVNGAAIQSLAIEGTDPRSLRRLQAALKIGHRENLSFPRALSRIMGLDAQPHGYGYG
jgi:hypothetical protein